MDALRPPLEGTRSVPGYIPTQSVGTIKVNGVETFHGRSASCRGRDAERPGLHSHAERGNDR